MTLKRHKVEQDLKNFMIKKMELLNYWSFMTVLRISFVCKDPILYLDLGFNMTRLEKEDIFWDRIPDI